MLMKKMIAPILLILFFNYSIVQAQRPNIIYIYTDQQSEHMMSCAGNPWLKTPAIDYLANNGIRFTRAYTTNPVCTPARVSMITGRFAGAFKDNKGQTVRENHGAVRIPAISDEVKNTTIASYLQQAGYTLYYGGKEHLPKPLKPKTLGFQDFSDDERGLLADKAAEIIKQPHDKPFFMIISFINPHDICYMALRDFATTGLDSLIVAKGEIENQTLNQALQRPAGVDDKEFYTNYCPPLPKNFKPQIGEPAAIRALLERRSFRVLARVNYTEEQWRLHRWAYCRLTELVDQQIQVILDALKESGQEEETLIMLSSDHGDMDASHRMEHKSTLYEEAANIPFIAMWKGHIPPNQVNDRDLVSNGLDLLPTLGDYAGIDNAIADPRGRSLRPLFEGKKVNWRQTLGVESEVGRMVVSAENLKYIVYDTEGIEKQLLDLHQDPYETKHFTRDSSLKSALKKMKKAFKMWFPKRK